MQINNVLCSDEFQSLVNLYLTKLNRRCGLFQPSNYDFIKGSCSSNHAQTFFNWKSSLSKYNSHHVFGIADLSGHGYRFIEVDSNGDLKLSSSPVSATHLCNYTNNSSLFLYVKSFHSNQWTLKHVATGQYVSINSKTNRVILNNFEAAAEFNIV